MGLSWFRRKCSAFSCKWEVHLTYKQKLNGNKLKNAFATLFTKNTVAFA